MKTTSGMAMALAGNHINQTGREEHESVITSGMGEPERKGMGKGSWDQETSKHQRKRGPWPGEEA
jgi:hypothetical protein